MTDEINTAALIQLSSRRKKPTKSDLLDLGTLHPGSYLAADPSLGAFGLVLFEVSEDGRSAVHLAAKFNAPPTETATGWEDILTRADLLAAQLEAFLVKWVFRTDWGHVFAVHEAPPIGRGKLINPEISLLASREFRRATDRYPMLPMVRRQDHCKLVCGNSNASKTEHHRALKTYLPAIDGSEIVTNEAIRDATSVALAAATRGFA